VPEVDADGWPIFPAQQPLQQAVLPLGLGLGLGLGLEEQLFSGSVKAADGSLSPLDGLLTPKEDGGAVTPPPSQRASVGGGRRKHLSLELKSDDLQRAMTRHQHQMSAQEVAAKLGAVVEGNGEGGEAERERGEGLMLPGAAEADGLAPAIAISPGGARGSAGAGPADRWSIRSGRIDVDGLFKISSKVCIVLVFDASILSSCPHLYLTQNTHQTQGIVFANEERHHSAPLVNRNGNNFIELMELGQGNGGAVFKALHIPSMKVRRFGWRLCLLPPPPVHTRRRSTLSRSQSPMDRWWP
jgi:hypothetical protein